MRDVFRLAPLARQATGSVTHALSYAGEVALLGSAAVGYVWRRRVDWREVVRQACVIGWGSLPAVLVTVFFSGAVAALHTADQFVQFGLSQIIGGAVAVSTTPLSEPDGRSQPVRLNRDSSLRHLDPNIVCCCLYVKAGADVADLDATGVDDKGPARVVADIEPGPAIERHAVLRPAIDGKRAMWRKDHR